MIDRVIFWFYSELPRTFLPVWDSTGKAVKVVDDNLGLMEVIRHKAARWRFVVNKFTCILALWWVLEVIGKCSGRFISKRSAKSQNAIYANLYFISSWNTCCTTAARSHVLWLGCCPVLVCVPSIPEVCTELLWWWSIEWYPDLFWASTYMPVNMGHHRQGWYECECYVQWRLRSPIETKLGESLLLLL